MAQRYVRVKTPQGQTYYGLLELDRRVQVLDAPPWLGGQPTRHYLPADDYILLPPCAPSKIIAVGRNYAAHASELGNEVPTEPLLFLKPPTTAIADGQAIEYPSQSEQVDYEGELALVIGERLRHCPPAQAQSKIWGYTIANDVTARDLQRREKQWLRAKGFDTFCPLGPWLVRELSAEAHLQTFLNDEPEPRQSASLQQMIFSPAFLVAHISEVLTLLPGDVILTGTPAGVGPMQVGDRVRVEIAGIGSLENSVVSRQLAATPAN